MKTMALILAKISDSNIQLIIAKIDNICIIIDL